MNDTQQQLGLWPEISQVTYSATKIRPIVNRKPTPPTLLPFTENPKRYADLILASASPSKADILTRLGLKFTIDPADVDERSIRRSSPEELVSELARMKGHVVSA